ncbi:MULTISPECIES: hypothetical protein [Streptomyces]|uniref:Uncharacterized protein n=1 Tax=Streptomyces silvisoli TaxID=3034235 RepID=A0ABT5ZI64_9ACTN|nr:MULTISPECIES: hypothetical protein [Streptomyces]MDF3289528.1 hypothetical protein [Streptomyces silvisoli]
MMLYQRPAGTSGPGGRTVGDQALAASRAVGDRAVVSLGEQGGAR